MSPVKDKRKGGVTAVDPRKGGIGPRTTPSYSITVRTFNAFSVSLPNCTVELYLTATDALVETKNSGALGACTFTVADNTTQYYVKGIKTSYTSAESAHTIVGGDTVDLTLIAITVSVEEQVGGWSHRSLWEQAIAREKRRREEEEIMLVIKAFLEVQARRWVA